MTPARRGVTLLESVVAFGLLAAMVAVSLEMLAVTAAQRRAIDKRVIALTEAANVAERIATLPWDRITPEGLADVELSPAAQKKLPRGVLKLAVEPAAAGLPARRVDVEITWALGSLGGERPVRLSFWAYAPPGGAAP